MRNLTILFTSLVILAGCQSYPKKPTEISHFDSRVPVNKTIPSELQPYYVYKPIQKEGSNEAVPNLLYVLQKGESAEEVQIRLEQKGLVESKSKTNLGGND